MVGGISSRSVHAHLLQSFHYKVLKYFLNFPHNEEDIRGVRVRFNCQDSYVQLYELCVLACAILEKNVLLICSNI